MALQDDDDCVQVRSVDIVAAMVATISPHPTGQRYSAHRLVVPLSRDVLRGLRASLGVAERQVVRVRLVPVAAAANVLPATGSLALRVFRSRREVFRIERCGHTFVLRDPDEAQDPQLPPLLEVRKHGDSAADVAEVPEGDFKMPSDGLEAVLQDDRL